MTAPDRDDRARKVARLYASGLSIRQAAKRAGIHHQTAADDLNRLGRGTFGAYRRRLDRRHAAARDKRMLEAVRLRTAGKSLRQSAADLGVSHQTIANDLARWDAAHSAPPANVIRLSRKPSKSGAGTGLQRGENERHFLTAITPTEGQPE